MMGVEVYFEIILGTCVVIIQSCPPLPMRCGRRHRHRDTRPSHIHPRAHQNSGCTAKYTHPSVPQPSVGALGAVGGAAPTATDVLAGSAAAAASLLALLQLEAALLALDQQQVSVRGWVPFGHLLSRGSTHWAGTVTASTLRLIG